MDTLKPEFMDFNHDTTVYILDQGLALIAFNLYRKGPVFLAMSTKEQFDMAIDSLRQMY